MRLTALQQTMHIRRNPYSGTSKKLVLGIDVGTTYSGVSYVILEPGKIPEVKGVNRFPAQEHVGGDSKIPSIILYDKNGHLRAGGAEVLRQDLIEQAEDEGWYRVEWFKLHLCPENVKIDDLEDINLPPGFNIVRVYSDLLRYLLNCTRQYIEETHPGGETLWASLRHDIDYVITHPNGWEGPQQVKVREAVIAAGLVPRTAAGLKRVQFLTEGEASLHSCIQHGLSSHFSELYERGEGVIIVDAGGGTVDVSAYGAESKSATSFQELSPSECCFKQGSVFVTRRAKCYLQEHFKNTRHSDEIERMAQEFDKNAKLLFRSVKEPCYIQFGRTSDRDERLGVRSGRHTIEGKSILTGRQHKTLFTQR